MPPRRNAQGVKPRPAAKAVISTMLRNLLTSGEHSLFAVARDSGVSLSSLTRFVSGERDLKLGTLDQLADVLGLKLVETGRDRVRQSKSPRPQSRRSERETIPVADETSRTPADAGEHLG